MLSKLYIRLDNEKSKSSRAIQRDKSRKRRPPQNKKGHKKDNETKSPGKSKRKTKVPAKFLDRIDFSKDVNTISLSVVFPFTVRPFLAPKGIFLGLNMFFVSEPNPIRFGKFYRSF